MTSSHPPPPSLFPPFPCLPNPDQSSSLHTTGGGGPISLDLTDGGLLHHGHHEVSGTVSHQSQEGSEWIHTQQTPVCPHYGGMEIGRGIYINTELKSDLSAKVMGKK